MKLLVNGKEQQQPEDSLTVTEIMERNTVNQPELVSIHLNGTPLTHESCKTTTVKDGDQVLFLSFSRVEQASRKKLSIIRFSGDFDKLTAAFTLATGSAALGYEVNLFFTFWGLNALKKKAGHRAVGKGFLARFFNLLMGGLGNAPLGRLNFGGISPRLMRHMMRQRNVATLEELVDAAKVLGVNLYPCEMSMHIMGLTKADFIPETKDVLGVASFLEISEGGDRIFI